MKTYVNYLPTHKQEELNKIINLIKRTASIEMIILFGSYARNDWVEEKYDDEHYRYQSDFDLLVIVETKSDSMQAKLESSIESTIDACDVIQTPVSIIVHDIEFVNRRLRRGQYFFTDIKKEGVLLYDSGKYQLDDCKTLPVKERKKLAEQDFQYWFDRSDIFYKVFQFCLNEQEYNNAAFELHQVTERLYSGILIVFTRYKPNTHNLSILRKLTNSLDKRLLKAFPLDASEDKRLFKLLCKAYVDARYKPSYQITQAELQKLAKQVATLKNIGQSLCTEKINSFT